MTVVSYPSFDGANADQASLRGNEVLLRIAQRAGRIGIYDWDLSSNRATYSGEYVAMHGLPPGTESESFESWRGRIHPEDRDRAVSQIGALDADAPFEIGYRIVRPNDGEVRWIAERREVLRDTEGRAVRVIGSQRDVTAQRLTEIALRESEQRLASAISTARLSVYEFDIPGRKLHCDDRIREIWGYAPSLDVSYEAFLDGIHPDDRKRVREAAEMARHPQGPGRFDMKYRVVNQHTGVISWVHDISEILFDGARPVRMLGIAQDITSDKQAEARLARSEARFRAAVQAVSGIVWTNNAAGEMEDEQLGWAALTGQSFEDYQGYGWSNAVHPEDARPTIDAWAVAVAARQPFVFEHRVRRHDGAWRRFAVRAIPVLNEDGKLQEWVGVHTDVTEQREAEAVLMRGREELERLVDERTRDLTETQQRLAHAQRMEALGQLAGGIAHDFNNVLQAVEGGASLIEKRANDSEAVRRLARMMAETATRGSSITRRLLAFSRRRELRSEAVDPIQLLVDLREVLTHTMGAGIGVLVDAPGTLPALLADKGQLETVLLNLAANSRDAMEGKGVVTLGAALDTVESEHPSRLTAGRYVRLSVGDTGGGMTPEVLAQATEPFFTTKGVGKGTGLGLAMARGFAQQSGGGLHIQSAPGRGTIVSVWLPLAQEDALRPASERSDGASNANLALASVLVVDDEPIVAEVLAEGLRGVGYRVTQASSGATALALLDAGAVADLIVSDLSMPEMSGLELVAEVRKRRPDLPAILLTGFATGAAELMVGGSHNEAFSLLRKPVTAEQLADQVAVLIEKGRLGNQAEACGTSLPSLS